MRSTIKYLEIVLIFELSLQIISSELFSAIAHLRQSLKAEKQVIYSLEEYLSSEEKRLLQLRHIKEQFSQMHVIANKDVHSFLANPINGYLLVKRLTSDWGKMKILLTQNGNNSIVNLPQKYIFPSAKDLTESTEAILILQNIYKLKTKNLANGIISTNAIMKGVYNENHHSKNPLSLNADDCFVIGKQAYDDSDYFQAIFWLNEAINRLNKGKLEQTDYKNTILDYLAFATFKVGNIERALEMTREMLKIEPTNLRLQYNMEFYKYELIGISFEPKSNVIESNNSTSREKTEIKIYESLCRGENRLTDKTRAKLFCFNLNTSKIPYLRYSIIKVEEAFKKPQILIFHDILSDFEIEVMKFLSETNLIRSKNKKVTNKRVSKQTFLNESDHYLLEKISTRFGLITGLDISTSNKIQVVNYGIGGYYLSHYDYALPGEKKLSKSINAVGNRIATWLSYMSDVEAGGATVFPLLGITIWPKKSSAIFWYNLDKSGNGDMLTKHAGCPVLMGSKWVSNKWYRERGQEFKNPCSKRKNEFNIIQKI